jgi:WD40 repeat protein
LYHNLILLFVFLLFSAAGGFLLFSQNLKDYDPRLYEMARGGKDPKEIEKIYNPSHPERSRGADSRLTRPDTADPYFGWEGHYGAVYCAAFNNDGTLLASGGDDGTIRIWNTSTGTLIITLLGHPSNVRSVAFSPDGTKLASGSSDNTIKLWNVNTGTVINTLSGHTDIVTSVTFSPDGTKLASGSYDKTIKLWNVSTGTLINTLSGYTNYVCSVAFSPDGTKLASGSGDNTIKIWNVSNGSLVTTLTGHTYMVNSVSFSPDGLKLASVSDDSTIKIWNTTTWNLIKTLSGHTSYVQSVSFSSDGTKLASGDGNAIIKFWNTETWNLINTVSGYFADVIWSVTFSPDGTKLASCDNWGIKIINVLNGSLTNTLLGHTGNLSSVSFSPDGTRLASGSSDFSIKIWNPGTGNLINTLSGHTGPVYSVSFLPDGTKIASGSYDNTIKLWSTATGNLINTLSGHTGYVHSVSFSPDGTKLASGGNDKTIKLWNVNTGTLINTLSGHTSVVYSIAFSPDGTKLASGSWDNTIKLWNVSTGTLINTMSGHTYGVNSVTFSPDGTKLASGSYDNTIKLWNVNTGTVINTLSGHTSVVNSVAFSPDGTKLASGGNDNTIKLWDVSTGTLLRTIIFDHGHPSSISYNNDGTKIASGGWGYKNLRIYDASVTTSTTAATNSATNITSNSATLNGVVNANNNQTTITFEYGTTTNYGNTMNATPNTVSGTVNTPISAVISGLIPNTTYHFRVKAVNSSGTFYGKNQTFNTLQAKPAAITNNASNVITTSATLNGVVNANNNQTTITFEYGTSISYGNEINATPNIIIGTTDISVNAILSNLSPNITYHFRVKAINSSGTSYGDDKTFTTSGLPEINLSANSIDFKLLRISNKITNTANIQNTGSKDLIVSKIEIQGSSKDEFTLNGINNNITLTPNNKKDFSIEFSPKSSGDKTAYCIITSNADNKPIDTITFGGRGIDPNITLSNPNDVATIGSDKTISFSLKETYLPAKTLIYYRPGGAIKYDSSVLTSTSTSVYSYTFPKEFVSIRGIEYYMKINWDTIQGTLPETDYLNHPLFLPVKINTIECASKLSDKKYSLLSVPLSFTGSDSTLFKQIIRDFGRVDNTQWRILKWMNRKYEEMLSENALDIKAGDGFWMITSFDKTLTFKEGLTTHTNYDYKIKLQPGWNQIGNPFLFPISASNLIIPQGKKIEKLWEWDNQINDYKTQENVMTAWSGYFIKNNENDSVEISIRPIYQNVVLSKENVNKIPLTPFDKEELNSGEWKLRVQVENSVKELQIGALINSSDEWDVNDLSAAPPSPEGDRNLNVYIPHQDFSECKGNYVRDFREPGKIGYTWNITLHNYEDKNEYNLMFTLEGSLPKEYSITLYDQDNNRYLEISNNQKYPVRFNGNNREKNIQITIGSSEYIEKSKIERINNYTLYQNYPNPFNPSTVISYQLPVNSYVSLKIYNTLGQEVQTLIDKQQLAGNYDIEWSPRTLPSGVYFYRLQTEKFSEIKKTLYIR